MQESAIVDEYLCPGERHAISRAVHLGRLGRFYPACRRCPRRDETGSLSARRVRLLRQVERRGARQGAVWGEGIAGVVWNQLTPGLVRESAAAYGLRLRGICTYEHIPSVLIASDGRPVATQFVAAVGEGLRWTGCHTVEIGPATAPATAAAVSRFGCDGGVFVGNPAGGAAQVGVRFWGPEGVPLSWPDSLEDIGEIAANRLNRPTRRYGSATRLSAVDVYLDAFRERYHALRPLRFIVECSIPAMASFVGELIAATACELTVSSVPQSLACQVLHRRAHFGIRVDEDGERCQVVDERGCDVAPRILAPLLAWELPSERPHAILDVATREATYLDLRRKEEVLAVDGEGHFWYRENESPWTPDGLMTLSLLLGSLSRSDKPLSELLGKE